MASSVLLAHMLCLPLPAFAVERPSATSTQSDGASLPLLENDEQSDRLLLREISDKHIFNERTNPQRTRETPTQPSPIGNQPADMTLNAWEMVRQSTRMSIPDHKLVAFYREQYRREAIWVTRILTRATSFIGHIVNELDSRYLPVELALLPAIESGYQPDVHSTENAAGIWQIIPTTAADMGITRTPWFDGRADIRQSTRAAVEYLGYLNAEFHGDWLLTLAAYNAGLGRVHNAVKRNANAGKPTDFWSLKLPKETRHYVPKFLALVAMLRYDNPRDLTIPKVGRGSAFDIVDVRQRIGLDQIAALTDIPEQKLRRLNAGLVLGTTPPAGPHLVYVPQGVGNRLINELVANGYQANSNPEGTHRVVSGDSISSIAMQYGISSQRLVALNELETDLIKIGETLWVLDIDAESLHVEYVVSIGDTLSEIAERFSMPLSDIRDSLGQKLESDVIHPGERLTLLAPSQTLGVN